MVKMDRVDWWFPYKTWNPEKPNSCMILPGTVYAVVLKFKGEGVGKWVNKTLIKSIVGGG